MFWLLCMFLVDTHIHGSVFSVILVILKVCVCVIPEVTPVFPQVHGGGGGYDSDFSGDDDEQGESSEKSLKR